MRTRRARFRWRIPLQPPKWHGAHHVVHRRIRRRRHLRCGMFDIVLGPFLTHFSRISQQAQGACHPPRVVWRALLGAPADWTLIGACNPMLCPTYGGHLGLGNANVDGFYLDDNWGRPAPSEEAFPCKDGILDTIFSDQLARIFAILTYFSAMPPHTLRATCSTWSQWALPADWCLQSDAMPDSRLHSHRHGWLLWVGADWCLQSMRDSRLQARPAGPARYWERHVGPKMAD